MDSKSNYGKNRFSLVVVAFLAISPLVSFAQNPNSATTTTGQTLTIEITSPEDGAVFQGGVTCEVGVTGVVTIDTLGAILNVVYVLDLSGSTGDPNNIAPLDLDGDGVVNAADDFNGDGEPGQIIDAEVQAAIALNNSFGGLQQIEVGIIGYATNAAITDVQPANDVQILTSPSLADQGSPAGPVPNEIPDIEEVLRSMTSDPFFGAHIGQFTEVSPDFLGSAANYQAALEAVLVAFEAQPEDESKIAYFLSDGMNTGGSFDAELAALVEAGIVVHTIGITQESDSSALSEIAESTGGTFLQVEDPTDLAQALPNLPVFIGIAEVTINGSSVELREDGTFATTLHLAEGEHAISATATAEDETSVTASLSVSCVSEPLQCNVEIISPRDGAEICGDSLKAQAVSTVSGGVQPITRSCTINGVPVASESDTISATIGIQPGANLIVVRCTYVDARQNQTTCVDSVTVQGIERPTCIVEITSPGSGAFFCEDSVEVKGKITVAGGAPPFEITCEVNAVSAAVSASLFSAIVPLNPGENQIVATCTVTDSCGHTTTCTDTIRVFTSEPPICVLQVTSPQDSAVICADTVMVEVDLGISGGAEPFTITCDINGIEVDVTNGMLMAEVALSSGENVIVATCTLVDSCGNVTVCRDSVTVFFDDIPPSCTWEVVNGTVKGTFFDEHSGIGRIVPVKLRNTELVLEPDPFEPGAKEVKFYLQRLDPDKSVGFSIDVFDICGNKLNCDPIFLYLSAERSDRQFEVTFPGYDRYLQVTNQGLVEIRIDLNGERFTLTTDAVKANTELNTWLMPGDGMITIDLGESLQGDNNTMLVAYDGPSGAHANLLLIDVVDKEPDFVLKLEMLPEAFQLAQNFPNPFNPTTKIQFDIPSEVADGVQVQLRVYNLLGELVRVLVDEQKSAGRHIVEWNARDDHDQPVSTGIYIYRLVAGEFRRTNRMLLLK